MNILIFCGYIDDRKTTDANVNIAKKLCKEISKAGHNVTLAAIHCNTTPKGGVVLPDSDGNYKIALITPSAFIHKHRSKLEQFVQQHPGLTRGASVIKYMIRHPVSAAIIKYSYSKLYKYDIPEKYAAKFVEKYCRDNHIDAAIAITFPSVSVPSVFDTNIPKCKKYIYQLDPYGLHETVPPEYNELAYFEKADGIFTTDILYKIYASHSDYKKYIDKIYISHFPTLEKKDALQHTSAVKLDADKTNIVFCGGIHDNYRNPKIFMDCLVKIAEKDKDIAVTFIGPHNSSTLDSYAALYPDFIKTYPSVESSYVPAILKKADLLLNVGNTYRLQVPSKIFEYFATGKPIIHQKSTDSCTCAEYMERYPLSFCIADSSNETADKLYTFIKNSKHQQLEWDIVSKIFSENIPHNVANSILKVLSSKL